MLSWKCIYHSPHATRKPQGWGNGGGILAAAPLCVGCGARPNTAAMVSMAPMVWKRATNILFYSLQTKNGRKIFRSPPALNVQRPCGPFPQTPSRKREYKPFTIENLNRSTNIALLFDKQKNLAEYSAKSSNITTIRGVRRGARSICTYCDIKSQSPARRPRPSPLRPRLKVF